MLKCVVEDGYVLFNAAEFSIYGIVGVYVDEEETDAVKVDVYADKVETDAAKAENNILLSSPSVEQTTQEGNAILWIVIAAVGIVALGVLVLFKRRTNDEQ